LELLKKIVLRKMTITIKICNIETFHGDIEYLRVTVCYFCIQSVRKQLLRLKLNCKDLFQILPKRITLFKDNNNVASAKNKERLNIFN